MKSEQKRRAIQIVGALQKRGATVAVDPIISLLQELVDAPEQATKDVLKDVQISSLPEQAGVPEAPAVQAYQFEHHLETVKKQLFEAQQALLNEGQQRDKLLAALTELVNQPQDITTPAYQAALAIILEHEK